MLNAGIDAELEWQWGGGHVLSEVLGDSFRLHVDETADEQSGHTAATRPDAETQSATETSGTNLSAWISLENGTVSFFLADSAACRTVGVLVRPCPGLRTGGFPLFVTRSGLPAAGIRIFCRH